MRERFLCWWAIGAAILGSACVQVERSGTHGAAERGGVALRISDWGGRYAERDAIPRRPRLLLEHAAGFAPTDDATLLLQGAADSELLADLERSPLLAAHRTRVVPVQLTFFGDGLGMLPDSALDADAVYTIAIASWARSASGARLDDAGPRAFELRTAAGPDAGARVLSSWPADGATAVGTNLAFAIVVFDGTVQADADSIWLEDPNGAATDAQITTGPCGEIAQEQAGAFCVRLTPGSRLAPSAPYSLVVGQDAVDAHAAPVGPFQARFHTAGGGDTTPPTIGELPCAIDEQVIEIGCALIDDASVAVRVQADEAVTAVLRVGARQVSTVAVHGDAVLRLGELVPDGPLTLELVLTDSAGNHTRATAAVRTLPPLATLTITELRADPLGPEPQQELVELWNYGDLAVDLAGFSLGDRLDKAGAPLAPHRVEPHARVLLVADNFDAAEPRDVQPPAGAALIRVGASLASSGLSNVGERLFLRDPDGRRVSAAPAGPRPRAGECNVRISADLRDGAEGSFDYAGDAGCTPGR